MTTLGTEPKTDITILGHRVSLYEQNTSYLHYLKNGVSYEVYASHHRTH